MPASASAAQQLRRLLVTAACAAACVACAAGDGGGAAGAFDIHLPPPTVLVSLESELIGHPTDIDVDASGRVWVADSRSRRLLVVDPAGGEPRLIGREGEGPGEFRAPARLAIADTLVHVIDATNSRVQQYRLDGTHVADRLIGDPMIGGGAVSRGGDVVAPTLGVDSALAHVYTHADSTRRSIGASIVTPGPWDFTAMKAEIAQGRVPDQFRNTVTPAFGADGTVWRLVQRAADAPAGACPASRPRGEQLLGTHGAFIVERAGDGVIRVRSATDRGRVLLEFRARLLQPDASVHDVATAPAGQRLAIVLSRGQGSFSGTPELFVASLVDGEPPARSLGGPAYGVRWTPDGAAILGASRLPGSAELAIYRWES